MVVLAGGVVVTQEVEQVRADGVDPVVADERRVGGSRIELGQGCRRPVDHADGDDPPQGHHRARRDHGVDVIEGEDLGPVGVPRRSRLVVDRRDGGLQLERSRSGPREDLREERCSLGEDEVERLEDGGEALGPLRVGRLAKRPSGSTNPVLDSADSLSDGRFGDE